MSGQKALATRPDTPSAEATTENKAPDDDDDDIER